MTDKPTRRDLMKPVQLLGLAFAAALFAGVVTLVTMGFFQSKPADQMQNALVVAAVAAGVTFIAVLVIVALLLLAVDPAQVTKSVDRPVLLPDEGHGPSDAATSGQAHAEGASSAGDAPAAGPDPADGAPAGDTGDQPRR